jgi:hypothetical protein
MPANFRARTVTLSNTAATRVTEIASEGFQFKADKFNDGPIYIGGADVNSSGNGYRLHPGEVQFIELIDGKAIFMIAANDGDEVSYFLV